MLSFLLLVIYAEILGSNICARTCLFIFNVLLCGGCSNNPKVNCDKF